VVDKAHTTIKKPLLKRELKQALLRACKSITPQNDLLRFASE
jgi:hypothetical protein